MPGEPELAIDEKSRASSGRGAAIRRSDGSILL
jgi:hypothetical protein